MRTTVDIPDDLYREVKAKAAHQGVKLKEMLERFIRHGLESDGLFGDSSRAKRCPLPIIIPSAGTKLPAYTNAELFAILDDEDAERYIDQIRRPSGC